MRHLLPLLGLALALACTGCHGPKGDCEGTLQSFAAVIDGNNWDDVPDLIYPPQRHKFGDAAIRNWAGNTYFGAKYFKFTQIDAQATKDTCLAQTTASWRQKIRGQNPEDFDDVYTYTLHLVGDKWYLEVPGGSKVSGFTSPPPSE